MIPDEAVEAAARAMLFHDKWPQEWPDLARAALEAAAPHLMASLRSDLVKLAEEFDAAEGGTVAYTTAMGPHKMRKNAHDQLMFIVEERL